MLNRKILETERAILVAEIEKAKERLDQLKGALQFCDWSLEVIEEAPAPEEPVRNEDGTAEQDNTSPLP